MVTETVLKMIQYVMKNLKQKKVVVDIAARLETQMQVIFLQQIESKSSWRNEKSSG